MNGLLLRAVLAFLLMPGVVAFLVPLLLLAPDEPGSFDLVRGLVPLTLGMSGLLWCVREFYVAGRGTLAPWAPPQTLVVTGLYRFSRNPMYIAVLLLLAGWALAFTSSSLAVYAAAMLIVFHIRVVLFEEPWLAERHGIHWSKYKNQVPRWLGLRRFD
jgi:protein-S-isoprenylcysteine O-methyltransferase Ste14